METTDIRNKGSSVPPWGWRGSWENFVGLEMRAFLRSLLLHIQNRWSDKPLNLGQVRSWIREYEVFQSLLKNLLFRYPVAKEAVISFEYELALEEGERPDILLHFPNGVMLVVECKNRDFPSREDFNQVRKYERSLILFHSAQHVYPVVLLLQNAKTELTDNSATNIVLCDSSEHGLKKFFKLLENQLESRPDNLTATFSPAECYQPAVELIASVVEAVNNATSPEHITLEQASVTINRALNEAREHSKHIMIALPGEKSSGKTPLGLRSVAIAWKQGISSIYLTGDTPPPDDVDAFFKKIGNAVGWSAASSFIRGMSQFPRFVSRRPLNSPFRMFVFDNTKHCLFPSSDNFPLHEAALVAHCDAQPWAVILVLVDFEGGTYYRQGDVSTSVKHWFQRLLLHKKNSQWTFLSPQSFGISQNAAEKHGISLIFNSCLYLGKRKLPSPPTESDIDPLQEARKRFNYHITEQNEERWQKVKQKAWQSFLRETGKSSAKEKFIWSKELLVHRISASEGSLMHGMPGHGVALIHELAACGRLTEVPKKLLTWEVLNLEEARPGRTPIRHAAKYGHIEQIPPESVAEHYNTVSQIAIEAVENSRSDRRATRRLETCRWLIKITLAKNIDARSCLAEARSRIEQMVDDVIREGGSIPAPLTSASMLDKNNESSVSFLESYLSDGNECHLDSSIFEFYLDRLIIFARNESKEIRVEHPTHTPGRAFHKRLAPRKPFPQQPISPKEADKPTGTQIDLF